MNIPQTLLPIIFLTVSACSTSPTRPSGPESSLNSPPDAQALGTADYGAKPDSTHQAQMESIMAPILKDPDSAKYWFAEPQTGWLPRYHFDTRDQGQPHLRGQVFGWIVNFTVNAKNSYGGYTGDEAYFGFFQDGKLRGILRHGQYKDIFGYTTWDVIAGPF